MNCPNCGSPEKTRVKYCTSCGESYASQDLLEMRQLEFLIEETATWNVAESLRSPYKKRLEKLKARLLRHKPVEPEIVAEPVASMAPKPEAAPATAPVSEAVPARVTPKPAVAQPKPVAPPKEKVPFDQWLLSERNIKIALYAGGLLLVVAGLIFMGVNWTRIPGPAKFAITLMITGLMYLGGYLLFQRPALRIGGVALLGVASGFLVIDFAVLQIYVLGPNGLPDNVMWLIASPLCLLLYMLTAYWTRGDLFTYLCLIALGSTATAALVLIEAPWLAYTLVYAALVLVTLLLAHALKKTSLADFTYLPLLYVSHIVLPLTFLAALTIVLSGVDEFSWLALLTLSVGVAFYLLNAYWTRHQVFSYICVGTLSVTVLTVLFLLDEPFLMYTLVFSFLTIGYLLLAFALETIKMAEFAQKPLLISSQLMMPGVILLTAGGWITTAILSSGYNPWLAILTLGVAVSFYVLTDFLFRWLGWYWRLAARTAAALLFPITFILLMIELGFSQSALGISLMVMALLYLGIGYFLEQKEKLQFGGWPLYGMAYFLAFVVTLLAIPNEEDLVKVLLGDVLILAVSAAIYKDYRWVYGAVWLFMLPVYLLISLLVPKLSYQGLFMGVLALNYYVAGYVLGRRELRLGWPFLTGAAFMGVVVVVLTWSEPIIAGLMLILVAVLYLVTALWLKKPWLLYGTLLAVNIAVLSGHLIFSDQWATLDFPLVISYFALGVVLALVGLWLRRNERQTWAWPLYIVSAINLGGAYLGSLIIGGWLAVATSILVAMLMFSYAWLESNFIETKIKFALLTYVGIGTIFIGHFYVLKQLLGSGMWGVWPAYTAGLCMLFTAIAWLLRQDVLENIYGRPLRYAGLVLMAVPLVSSLYVFMYTFSVGLQVVSEWSHAFTRVLNLRDAAMWVAVSFAIAGFTYAIDGIIRRSQRLVYISVGAFLITIWAVFLRLGVFEPQAYIISFGLILLVIGWNERRHSHWVNYKWLSRVSLILLMGSALLQSILRGEYYYAILVLGESLIAIILGIRSRSRCYVQLGGLFLLANAIVQIGPGFVELPRWVQIGLTGGILLGGGLVALFKREDLLVRRENLTNEWRQWNP